MTDFFAPILPCCCAAAAALHLPPCVPVPAASPAVIDMYVRTVRTRAYVVRAHIRSFFHSINNGTMASRPVAHRHLPLSGLIRRAGSAAKTVFAVAGVLALGSAALDFQLEQERKEAALRYSSDDNNKNADDEDASSAAKAKKEHQRILVLPFYRMKVVEKKKANALSSFAPQLIDRLGSDADSAIQIEAHDLVDIIHSAAEDPDIVGLYGVFGHGGGFSAGGYGHIEEVRSFAPLCARVSMTSILGGFRR